MGCPEDISPAAFALIVTSEVGSAAEYASRYNHPLWPGGESGVTIGVGEDLGQLAAATFRTDWEGYLKAGDLARLAQCCGVRGARAAAMATAVADIEISYGVAMIPFRHRRLPGFIRATWETFPNCASLPPDAFGALVSLVFNRGPSLKDPPGDERQSRLEMREIHDAMAAGHFDDVPYLIREMQRLWPDLPGLQKRRAAEADLFAGSLRPS